MSEIATSVISGLVLMLCGALGTGLLWLAQRAIKAKKSLDCAHRRIRDHEDRLVILEEITFDRE